MGEGEQGRTRAERGRSGRGTWRKHVAVAITAGLMATLLATAPAAAHGVPDQATKGAAGNEPCSAAEYPGSKLVTLAESRQSFVPSRGGIASVEVCIQGLVGLPGTDFTVNLYDGGTAAVPGPRVATKAVDVGLALLAAQWVHVDLDLLTEVPTTPGATYVLGLDPAAGILSSVVFQWRATCNDGLLTTCSGTPDSYPLGTTNDLPGNADYAFRTFPLHAADLIGEVAVDDAVCPGLDLTGHANGTVRNVSNTSVGPFTTEWVWSEDPVLDAGDRVIPDSQRQVSGIAANGSALISPPTMPADLALGAGHLLLHIDINGQVIESDDANNVAAGPTSITVCGQPAFDDLTVSVTQDVVATGAHEVQFTDLDPAALATLPQSAAEARTNPGISANGFSANGFSANGFSANGFSANGFSANGFSANGFSANGFSANGFSANGFSANGFSPAGDVLLTDVLRDLPADFAQQMPVVEIPIVGTPWSDRLAPFTSEPVQNITLAQASALLPLLTLGELDLTHVFTMSWLGLALGHGTLNDTPLPGGQSWTALGAEYGFDFPAMGVNPSTTSLLGLEATGFPTHQAPIADLPLSAINLDAPFLVFDMPLAGTPNFSLEHTRLGRVSPNVALTNPSAVVDCASFDCDRPLAEAAAAGALRDVTAGTLVRGLTAAGRASSTVGDLAMGLASLNSLNLATANWNLANPYNMDNACPQMTYVVQGTNTGSAEAVDPEVTTSLAPGFVYVPGTVVLRHDGGASLPQTEPTSTIAADGTRTYRFALSGAIEGPFELEFAACAGLYLGYYEAGQATIEGSGLDGPYTGSTAAAVPDTVQVVERTPGVTSRALVHEDNVVVFDHISSTNSHDSWTFQVKPEPGTMYIAKLFSPIDTDLDLIGFAPAISANGFSANGFSANGFSANGFSANGFSANGFSANGFSANGFSANGFSANGFSATASSEVLDDLAIQELAPPGSDGHTISSNRGDTPETLYMFSSSGDAGSLTFSVTNYGLPLSDAPYVFTLQTVRPTPNPALATCQAAPWDLTKAAGAAPATWSGTEPPRTLFVTNRQVVASTYGNAAADAGIAALQGLAARPDVRGIVLMADHDANVRAAYGGWRSDWCNPTKANIAASHVRSRILQLRAQYPSIDTVILAGGDEIVPDFRLRDGSFFANESHYLDALLKAVGGNNALVATYANGLIPTSDPYGNKNPLPFSVTMAFPPEVGVSRLVETPADWVAQKTQFEAANGTLDPKKGFISAESGMVDGAHAAADVLAGRGVPMTRLTDEAAPWTAANFRTGAFTGAPDVAGYNAHANHFSLLSAKGSKDHDPNELVLAQEALAVPFGSFIFSNGCHFGTSVPNVLNPNPTAAQGSRLLDWNQAIAQRRGIAVTNSGFGIFDTDVVGQGERLQVAFLEESRTAPNVAIALARAKMRFFASPGTYDAYSYKTLHQVQMYGLGVLKMLGATPEPPAPQPAASTTSIDVTVGPYTVDTTGASSCTSCYRLTQSPTGTKVDLVDANVAATDHTSTSGYWSAPLSVQEDRLPPGKLPAGIWFKELASVTLPDLDPVITRLAVHGAEKESQTAAPFPTTSGMVNAVGGTAVTTLLHGINVPTRMEDGKVRSDVHLYTKIGAELLLRPDTTIGCSPHIDEVTVVHSDDDALAVVDVLASELCGPNTRAAVIGRDDTGAWTYRELTKGVNGHWTGAIALANGATELVDAHVQVAGPLGVGHWRNKGDKPLVTVQEVNGVDLALSGPQHSSGVFLGDVTATVLGTSGALYRVYDNGVLLGTFPNGGSFVVTGEGAHDIEVRGSDGSGYRNMIAIDGSTPTIDVRTPPAGASYQKGTVVPVDVLVADTGTGATFTIKNDGQTIANGAPLNTSTAGQHTVVVTASDQVGHVAATVTTTYTVRAGYVISEFFSPIAPKPTLNVVKTGSSIAVKFTVTDANGNAYNDPAIIRERVWRPINCKTKAIEGAEVATVGTTPEYSGFFHFNTTAPAGAGCYELIVRLDDGTMRSAYFQVKR